MLLLPESQMTFVESSRPWCVAFTYKFTVFDEDKHTEKMPTMRWRKRTQRKENTTGAVTIRWTVKPTQVSRVLVTDRFVKTKTKKSETHSTFSCPSYRSFRFIVELFCECVLTIQPLTLNSETHSSFSPPSYRSFRFIVEFSHPTQQDIHMAPFHLPRYVYHPPAWHHGSHSRLSPPIQPSDSCSTSRGTSKHDTHSQLKSATRW
jgi:hypothetical protein